MTERKEIIFESVEIIFEVEKNIFESVENIFESVSRVPNMAKSAVFYILSTKEFFILGSRVHFLHATNCITEHYTSKP